MAALFVRNGIYNIKLHWKASGERKQKPYTRSLRTTDLQTAERIRRDVEDQLERINSGRSPVASKLLADGFSIIAVLFGSPEVATRLDGESDHNPLAIGYLCDGYLAQLKTIVGFDQHYNTELWLKRARDLFGEDRRVMSLAGDDLTAYAQERALSVGNTSIKKEVGSLKAAIRWAIDEKLLSSNPIRRWPTLKTQRQKHFLWKSDIDAVIAEHELKSDAERADFLGEMKLRLVLTQEDMKALIDLAREKSPEMVVPLMLVCSTGIRRKELVMLKKSDFDPRRGAITVGSKKQSKTEEVTYRMVALPVVVAEAVSKHHRSLPKSERMLFPAFSNIDKRYNNRWVEYKTDADGEVKLDETGRKIVRTNRRGETKAARRKLPEDRLQSEKARRMLNQLIKDTDFELMNGWHCLRHSFISICVSKGLTWEQIAEWVGHVSPRTTRLYTHFNLVDSKRRIESLDIRF
ncbi:MAG: site-specific integrase [Planctomycetes bacterium]|nr:site-specific integrase [Planctomycetota bacterium]